MCRPNVIDGEPELEQIGRITGVDITPIKDMEKYWDEENIESQLSFAGTELERQEILQRIDKDKRRLRIILIKFTKQFLIRLLNFPPLVIYQLYYLIKGGTL